MVSYFASLRKELAPLFSSARGKQTNIQLACIESLSTFRYLVLQNLQTIFSIPCSLINYKSNSFSVKFFSSPLNRHSFIFQDADAASATASMLFSLDGSMPLLDLIPAIVMLADFCVIVCLHFFIYFSSFAHHKLLFIVSSFAHHNLLFIICSS